MSIEFKPNTPESFQGTREGDHLGRANYYVQQVEYPDRERVSDGYHSFGELYTHRIHLMIALAKAHALDPSGPTVYITKKHKDGSEWPGWFVLGISDRPGEQVSYHLPEKYWDICAKFAMIIPSAIFYDEHTSEDVLRRLLVL
jgi:hypothetical protein